MSVLSSTNTGYEYAHFKELQARKEKFYNEVDKEGSCWKPGINKTYTEEEFIFLMGYISKNGYITDEKFLVTVATVYYLLHIPKIHIDSDEINNQIVERMEVELSKRKLTK